MKDTKTYKMNCHQKYLSSKGLIVFIASLATITPMTIDMYLPALPGMTEYFSTTESLTNFTILFYFLFYAISLLFWGPVSDKHGRKSVLFACIALYTIGSIGCIFSPSILILIICRVIQATGAGGISSIAMAIVKDSFEGRQREVILAIIQSMVFLGPILAPIIGGIVVSFASWQWIFVIFSVAGFLSILTTILFQETHPEQMRNQGRTFESLKTLVVVLKNIKFSILLVIFSNLALPFFAYLSVVSYIFQNTFSLNEQQFSYFFSAIALIALSGPYSYIQISKRLPLRGIITASFVIFLVSGLSLFFYGSAGPFIFTVFYVPIAVINSFVRTPATNLLLEQEPKYAGAASSLIGFAAISFGCAGMALASLIKIDYIHLIAFQAIVTGLISLILWLRFGKEYC